MLHAIVDLRVAAGISRMLCQSCADANGVLNGQRVNSRTVHAAHTLSTVAHVRCVWVVKKKRGEYICIKATWLCLEKLLSLYQSSESQPHTC